MPRPRNALNCCRKLLHNYSAGQTRSAICKKWISPLKILVSLSLVLHLIHRLQTPPAFYSWLLIVIHVVIGLLILGECRRSSNYFKTLREYEAGQTAETGPWQQLGLTWPGPFLIVKEVRANQ
jgi:hypothetical protein